MTELSFRQNGSPKLSWKSSINLALRARVEGHWRQGGVLYRDDLVKIIVDFPESAENREWMREFKSRWKERFQQLELWMVSYRIEVE